MRVIRAINNIAQPYSLMKITYENYLLKEILDLCDIHYRYLSKNRP